MEHTSRDFRVAAIISFLLVLPLAILEVANTTIGAHNAFGLIMLFGVMWLLPLSFIIAAAPVVRAVRAGAVLPASLPLLVLRLSIAALVGAIWVWALADQLPCFLGVPNCD